MSDISAPMPAEVAFALRTRALVKMGTPFDDPQMAQACQQLGLWPQLLFDFKKGADGKFLVETKVFEEDHIVCFNMVLETIPEKEDLQKRSDLLGSWVQQLLGEDWAIHVANRKSKKGPYKIICKIDRTKPLGAKTQILNGANFPEAIQSFKRYRTDGKNFGFDDSMDLGPILK